MKNDSRKTGQCFSLTVIEFLEFNNVWTGFAFIYLLLENIHNHAHHTHTQGQKTHKDQRICAVNLYMLHSQYRNISRI